MDGASTQALRRSLRVSIRDSRCWHFDITNKRPAAVQSALTYINTAGYGKVCSFRTRDICASSVATSRGLRPVLQSLRAGPR